MRAVYSPRKASRHLDDPDDPAILRNTEPSPPSSGDVPSLRSSTEDLLQLHEQLALNLREQLATLDQSLNADTTYPDDDERARVALLVKLRGLVNGLRNADDISSLCALAERLESEENRRSVRVGAGVAARYKAISRAAVRERFESDSAPGRALEIGEEIDVLESRVNSRGQLRVRFAGGWASVTAFDGATLLEPIAVVNCEPQLYRVLNRVTIRVGADVKSTSVGALEVGEFVTVLETRQLESGQLRARFQYTLQKTRLGRDGGWTSITTTDGERMMECIQDKTASIPEGEPTSKPRLAVRPQPQPEPEPEPEPEPASDTNRVADHDSSSDDESVDYSDTDSDVSDDESDADSSADSDEGTDSSAGVPTASKLEREQYKRFLNAVPLCKTLAERDRDKLAGVMQEVSFEFNENIIAQGESADAMYIVLHGTCEAFVNGVGKVMTYKEGDFFGELALLTGGKRNASVVAGSTELADSSAENKGRTRLLKLRSKDFKRLTRGGLGDVLQSQSKKYTGVDPAILLALPGLATMG